MWFLGGLAFAAVLEIEVPDPQVVAVVLECADGTYKSVVNAGVASFDRKPESCSVSFIRRNGRIDQPGRWVCDITGCVMKDVHHRAIGNADGRITIITATQLPGGSWLELNCGSGHRARADVTENTAIFENIPKEDCTLYFKGGAPAKFKPVTWGTYQCSLDGTTALCIER